MALTKDQKTAQVAELTDKMKRASSVMFSHYIGLSVGNVSDLRSKLREADAEMKVGKKTLMKLAAKEAGLPELEDSSIEGPVACIFSFGDPLTGAQVAYAFSKQHDQVSLIGGVYEGKILSKQEAIDMAMMPSRDVLLATFVGMIQAPLRNFASASSSPLSSFARALSQMAEKGGFAAAPAAEAPAPAPATEVTEETPAAEAAPTEEATAAPAAEETKEEVPTESADSSDAPPAEEPTTTEDNS